MVLQRGDRGAGGGREHDPAHLRGRARDRHHADRFRRRRARADADRGGRDGGAGALRAARAGRQPGAARARLLAALPGGAPHASCAPRSRALPSAEELLALPRQRLDHAATRLPRALIANAQIHHARFLARRRPARAAHAAHARGALPRADRRARRARATRAKRSRVRAGASGSTQRRRVSPPACAPTPTRTATASAASASASRRSSSAPTRGSIAAARSARRLVERCGELLDGALPSRRAGARLCAGARSRRAARCGRPPR